MVASTEYVLLELAFDAFALVSTLCTFEAAVRILPRAGLGNGWLVVAAVPGIGPLVFLLMLAMHDWPALKAVSEGPGR